MPTKLEDKHPIDDLINYQTEDVMELLRMAYDLGRAVGKQDGLDSATATIERVLGTPELEVSER